MKKSTFILASAAMLFALTGCEKKSSVEQQASGELIEKTFYANQGGKEKTTLDPSLATLWSEGDAIKVYPEAGGAGTDFTLESGAGESAATFTGLTTPSDAYVAFYPATKAQSISGSTVTFNIPATQVVTAAGSFDTNTVPMVGYTTDNSLAMMNVGSLFELGLKAKEGTPKVVKIELKGKNSENLAGDFTVDASVSGQPTATYSANGATTLTINCGEYESEQYKGIALNASDYTYFYISIPAGVFTKGFTATLTDADGKTAEVTTDSNISKGAATLTEFRAEDVEFKEVATRPACQEALDADANWVTIGSQHWLKVNTKCIEYDTESEAFEAGITTIPTSDDVVYTPYYTDHTTVSKPEYMSDEQFANLGMLYNWAAAVGLEDGESQESAFTEKRQGICPNGSHVPSVAEWNTLRDYLGESVAGKKMKTSTGWKSGTGEGDNGFAALPAGDAYGLAFLPVGQYAYYWSSDAGSSNKAYYRGLNYNNDRLSEYYGSKGYAFSVRCLKD